MNSTTISGTNGNLRLPSKISPRLRMLVVCACLIATPCAAAWMGSYFAYSSETPRTEIYRGVYYQTYQVANGLAHLVEIDLRRPGVELYLTPIHPEAVAGGHEYRLDYVRNAARAEGLAVAVNGNMFSSDSYLIPMVGDFAKSRDSVVADFKLNHLNPRDYILWFDKDLAPHAETTRPASLTALKQARWAIGGIDLAVRGRKLPPSSGKPGRRSLIGVDPKRKSMWIGVFELATQTEATEALMSSGAQYVMTLDGGDSASLYLGGRSSGVSPGLRFGGQRPVATVIGIKADAILKPL